MHLINAPQALNPRAARTTNYGNFGNSGDSGNPPCRSLFNLLRAEAGLSPDFRLMKYQGIEIGVVTPFDALFLHTAKVGWNELEEMATLPPHHAQQQRAPRPGAWADWPQTKDDEADL